MKKGRREFVAAEGSHEFDRQRGVNFKCVWDAGACLDLAEEMPQRRRPEPMKVLDVALSPQSRGDFSRLFNGIRISRSRILDEVAKWKAFRRKRNVFRRSATTVA